MRTQIRHSKETATRSSALLNLRPRFAFSSFPNHVITAKTTNFSFRSAGDNESEHNRILGISYQTAACYDDNLMKNLSLDGEQRCEARIEQFLRRLKSDFGSRLECRLPRKTIKRSNILNLSRRSQEFHSTVILWKGVNSSRTEGRRSSN